MNKTFCGFMSAAMVMAVSAVFADQYADWFKGIGDSPTSLLNLGNVGGTWSELGGDGVSFADSKIVLDDVETPISFTISASEPDTEVMDSVLITMSTIASNYASLPTSSELETAGAQFAVTVAKNNSVLAYYAWVGGDSWQVLSGATPVEDTQVKLLVDADYSVANAPKARISIVSNDGLTTNSLTAAGVAWLSVSSSAAASVRKISGIKLGGSGQLAKVDGSVRLGIAQVGAVKYPTIQAAVDAAATGSTKTVEVIRKTDEDVDLTGKSGVAIADNGNNSGTITVPADQEIKLAPAKGEFTSGTVTGGSGTFTLGGNFSGGTVSDSSVTLPDEIATYKEIVPNSVAMVDNNVQVTLRTKDSIVKAVTVGGKALTVTDGLRTFLHNKVSAYTAPESTTGAIQEAMTASGSNNLPVWQSYVLGLDPASATSTPKIVPLAASDTSTDKLKLEFPNINPPSDSGYTVGYAIRENNVPTGTVFDDPSEIELKLDSSVHAYEVVPVITAIEN